MRACLAEGRPYVVAPQGSFEPWALRLNRWGKLLYGAVAEVPLMARATRLQALTQNEADQIQTRLPGAAVTIVPNGVDVTAFEGPRVPLAKQLGLPAGTRTLLSLSRLHPKKGIDRLIEGLAGVARRLPGLAVVVAGHDAGTGYGETLRRRAAELGVSDRCHFIGERSGRDKAHVLLGADAFALISHSEGLPVAVLEALASGRAVIISRSCNLPEVAAHGAGVEVSGEPETVAAAIWDVCSDPQVAGTMGERGRVLARTRFAWERIAEQTLALYEACIAEGRNAAATTVSPL
jgi:poly(glycerol-phosphate) alpha-glucosyltransferase